MYSIKAIATLTGLSTETLRAWERRYQVVTPRRDASGRRAYSEQDLERLMLLADLTRHGHSIGKISRMDNRQLDSLIRQDKKGANSGHEQFIARVVEALLQYRVDRCEELLKRALLAYEPVDYVRNILQPTLQTVGQLWHEKNSASLRSICFRPV
nr:MerR family transcriptional regulator [Methylomarinum sp. Ch1-1]MDP4519594.1 MerR family transcriptional regulator [Methylomarinum sp. Ch1-1]